MSFIENNEFIIIWDYKLRLTENAMRQLVDIGIKTLQIEITWAVLEPYPNKYDISKLVDYLELAIKVGLKVIIKIQGGLPLWSPLDWFMKDDKNRYNLYFHANPIYGRNDFDENNFLHLGETYPKQNPSYWNQDAMEHYHKLFYTICPLLVDNFKNLFFCTSLGIVGEYYIDKSTFYDKYAIKSFRDFLNNKYKGDISIYNFLNKKNYENFYQIEYDTSYFNIDLYEWYFESILNETYKICKILKIYNPTNEIIHQFSMSRHFLSNNFFTVIERGVFDSIHMFYIIQKKLNIDKVSMVNTSLYASFYSYMTRLENILECKRYNSDLWTGSEGPDNIVNNTFQAIKNKQRGFYCGLIKSRDFYIKTLDKQDLDNIKKSLDIFDRYKFSI